MKKVLLLMSIFTGTMFVSCDEGLLEPFTPGALTEDVAIQTSTDLQGLMNSTYANMFSREDAVFTSVFTDEAGIGFANGGQGITDDYIFFMNTAAAAPNNIWTTAYFTLSRANRVIAFADRILPNAVDADDADKINRLKAEALAVRAYCHLKLMSYFSTDVKDNNALAAILADRVIPSTETNLQRATNGVFYTSIHADLDASIALFNGLGANAYNGITNRTYYANANFAKAMKARAYALKGDYTNAETWADNVITTSGVALASTSEYTKVFWTDNEAANTEVLFRLRRTPAQNNQGTNMHNGWCSVRPNATGSPFYEVSRALFNLMNPSNVPANQFNTISDIRLRTITAPSSVVDAAYATSADYRNTDKLIIQKYGGAATGTPWASTAANGNNNDYKVARISEMYLIKAEARAAAGDLTGAANAIKSILDARNGSAQTAPTFASQTAAFAEILKQRRIEFAFEGYRFIDLKRLASAAGVTSLDRDPADYSSSSANYPAANPSNLPMNSYKWALPIPQVEINANSVITQNPNY